MALSFHSNWETLNHLSPGVGALHEPHSELDDALLGFICDPVEASDFHIEFLFDPPNSGLYSETDSPLLSSFIHHSFSDPSVVSLPPDLRPTSDDFGVYQCPKRPRSYGDLHHPSTFMLEANSYTGLIPEPAMASWQAPEFLREFAVPPPAVGQAGCNGERKMNGGCSSAQSVAARERRKRISEKTQELGRLIPGGNKMNTAEMFHAASKYVKFMQAQVGILGLMDTVQSWPASTHVDGQLQVLLGSPTIQEALYGEGMCVVPKEVVETMADDKEVKSNPTTSRDLNRFIESMK